MDRVEFETRINPVTYNVTGLKVTAYIRRAVLHILCSVQMI